MKLLSTLAVPFLALGLTVAGCGKKTPDGTTPPGETGGGGDTAGGGGGDAAGGGDTAGGGGDAAGGGDTAGGGDKTGGGGEEPAQDPNKVCDAEVGGTPTALFANNVVVRLPKGMELVEENPFFARISTKDTVSTCDAIINFSAVGYFQADPSRDVKKTRDETLAARGLPSDQATWSEETVKGRDFTGAYELPADEKGNPPIKGWMVLKEKNGFTFWYLLETHPNAWNALKKTFQESGKKLLIVPQAGLTAPALGGGGGDAGGGGGGGKKKKGK